MTELRWHSPARNSIAPRVASDLPNQRGWWRLLEWAQVVATLQESATAAAKTDDDSLAAALARVQGWQEEPPKDTASLEIEILLELVGAQRISEYVAKQFGVAVIAPMLAAPALECKWDSAAGAKMLRRVKGTTQGRTLRTLLLRDPAALPASKAALQGIWDAGDVLVRQQLAFAFAIKANEDDAWRAAALEEIVDKGPPFDNLQLALARDEASVRALLARAGKTQSVNYPEIVATLGEAALPLLLEIAPTIRGSSAHRSHALAMSVFSSEPAAKHLAGCVTHPSTRKIITDYFVHNKELAAKVLPAASQGASRNAALAKALLVDVCGAAALEATKADAGSLVAIDDPALPGILRAAPWRNIKPALPNLGLDLATYPVRVELPPNRIKEGLDWLASQRGAAPEMTPDEVAAVLEKQTSFWRIVIEDKALPLDVVLKLYNEGKWGDSSAALAMLAKFGTDALPGLRAAPRRFAYLVDDALAGIDDPYLAAPFAAMLEHSRELAALRWSWFRAQPRAAAWGLLAVAHDPTRSAIAEIVLRRMATLGYADAITEVARSTPHAADVDALLRRDARHDVLPTSSVTKQITVRPTLRDGRPLGDDAVGAIFEMMAFSLTDAPYIGFADVRQACDPRSLAEMAWELAALADGRPRRGTSFPDWMRWAPRYFADDQVIRRLTPALKHGTVYRVLAALTADGVRSATMELATADVRGDAPNALQRVAAAAGKTADELAEMMLPTTELEDGETTTLQYGSRELRVGFDTTLAPILFAGEKRLASLPRAKATDDPVAIRLARERWEELKEDVRTIARLRGRSLERAMRTGRKMTGAHFRAGWAHHPLAKHQARGVVWGVERDGQLVSFRVAEDSSLADVDDGTLELADTDAVRVPHPVDLGPAIVARWSQIFSDYGLIQPVPQLGRVPLPLTPEETAEGATTIKRDLSRPLTSTVFQRILHDQDFPSRRTLARGTTPGMAYIEYSSKWVERKYMVTQATLDFRAGKDKLPLSQVDPVELAEGLFVLRLALEAS